MKFFYWYLPSTNKNDVQYLFCITILILHWQCVPLRCLHPLYAVHEMCGATHHPKYMYKDRRPVPLKLQLPVKGKGIQG